MEELKKNGNGKSNPYECKMCELYFENEEAVIQHMLSHSKICHKCSLCDETFLDKAELEKHLLKSHVRQGGKVSNAPLQQQQYNSFSPKEKRDVVRRKGKRHKCPQCHKIFLHKSNLHKHLPSHNPLYSATQQVQLSQTGSTGMVHPIDLSTDVIECIQIKFEPEDEQSTGEHLECNSAVHDAITEETNSISKAMDSYLFQYKKAEDNLCNNKPTVESSCHKHRKRKSDGQIYTCDCCLQNFKSNYDLKNHLRLVHVANRSFPCAYCGSIFTRKSDMKRHQMYSCKSIPNYTCPVLSCNKVFVSEAQFDLHLKIHASGEVFGRLKKLAKDAGKHRDKSCKKCQEVFSSAKELADHSKKHHGPKRRHLCEDCGDVFTTGRSLAMHQKKAGNCWEKLSCFQCPDCSSGFPNLSEMRRHRLHCHPVPEKCVDVVTSKPTPRTFKCKKCLMVFLEHETLLKHQQSCSVDLFVCCATCGEKFTEIEALDKHVVDCHCIKPNANILTSQQRRRWLKGYSGRYSGAKHFKCGICDKVYDTARLLSYHISIHTGEDLNFICEICGSSFTRETFLKKHKANTKCGYQDRKHTCKFCKQKFSSATALKDHRSSKFGLRFTCEKCGTRLKSCYHLHKHYKTCGQVNAENNTVSSTCNVCGKTFANPNNMKIHMILHTGLKPFACGQCGRRFTFKQSLKRHFAVHGSNLAYKCSVCGKGFTTASTLKSHESTHLDLKLRQKFSCAECGQSFTKRHRLKLHEYLHSNKKPLTCQYCGKGFIKSYQLKCHLNSQHGVPYEEYPCKFCGQTFSSRFKLTKHLDLNCASLAATIQQLPSEPSLVASLRDDGASVPVPLSEETKPNLALEGTIEKPSEATKSTEIVIQEDDGNGNVTERTIIVTIPANVDMAQLLQNGLVSDPVIEYSDTVDSVSFEDVTQEDIKDVNLDTLYITCEHCGEVCLPGEEMENHLLHQHPCVESSELLESSCHSADTTSRIAASKSTDDISGPEDSTSEGQHMCQHCGRQFDSSHDLNDHVLKCEGVEVTIPEDPVDSVSEIPLDQVDAVTSEQSDIAEEKNDEQNTCMSKFVCEECGVQYSSLNDLHCHKLQMHNIIGDKVMKSEINNKDTCVKVLPSSNISQPVKSKERDKCVKPYPCDMCHKGFMTKQFLDDHRLTHTQGKGFVCTLCGKSFTNESTLLGHMMVHEPDNLKKFSCNICSKFYMTNRSLKFHMLKHLDEPLPYICEVCSKGFVEKRKLRYHRLHVHKIREG